MNKKKTRKVNELIWQSRAKKMDGRIFKLCKEPGSIFCLFFSTVLFDTCETCESNVQGYKPIGEPEQPHTDRLNVDD